MCLTPDVSSMLYLNKNPAAPTAFFRTPIMVTRISFVFGIGRVEFVLPSTDGDVRVWFATFLCGTAVVSLRIVGSDKTSM